MQDNTRLLPLLLATIPGASGALVLASSAGSDACGGLGSSAVLTELSLTHGNVNTPFGTALEIGGANGIELDHTVGGCSLHDDLAGTWIRVS